MIGSSMEVFLASPILLFFLPFFTYLLATNSSASIVSQMFDTSDWTAETVLLRRIFFDTYNTTIPVYNAAYAFITWYNAVATAMGWSTLYAGNLIDSNSLQVQSSMN